VIAEEYDYDAYGVAVGFDASSADTNLLYTGEQYDSNLSQYYLRARYYNPANGRFNRMDPFAGNNQDPQSLHKYLYANCSPTMNVDPSGNLSVGLTITIGVIGIVAVFLTSWLISSSITTSTKDTIKYWDVWAFGGSKIAIKVNGQFTTISAVEFINRYNSDIRSIATTEGIPPDLLAGVLYTELSGYAKHDLWFDNPSEAHSIGPAQLEVFNVKTKYLPSEYGSTTNDALADLLYTPESAIKILAKCIKYFDSESGTGTINEFRNTNNLNERARLSSIMNGIKDAGGIADYASDDYHRFAEASYLEVIRMAPGLTE